MRVLAQQRFGRHQHAGRAEAALGAELLVEGALQARDVALGGEAFDRLDAAPGDAVRQRAAGQSGLVVDQHGAGAAFAAVATLLGAGEAQAVAQVVEQQCVFRDGFLAPAPVDPETQYPLHASSS